MSNFLVSLLGGSGGKAIGEVVPGLVFGVADALLQVLRGGMDLDFGEAHNKWTFDGIDLPILLPKVAIGVAVPFGLAVAMSYGLI